MSLKAPGVYGILTFLATILVPVAVQAAIPSSEHAALIALYESTDGDHWTNNTNWRKSPSVFNDSGTECTWFGVTCADAQSHVSALALAHNHLSGPIPPELAGMVNLQICDLHFNLLTGGIPTEVANLANLQVLDLSYCQLVGPIPSELSNLTNLQELWLDSNQLVGPIPAGFGNLTNLQGLGLSENQLTGPIPPVLGNLVHMQGLWLSGNQLAGPIPPELGNLTNLQDLYLDSDQLTGAIPVELGNLASLQVLRASNNQLTGPIPRELGNLTNLQRLELAFNKLRGPIPKELANLTNLRQENGLYLAYNQLFTDDNTLREFLNSKHSETDWESSQTLHQDFAQFADGGGLFSQVVLFNLNDVAAATGQISILGELGEGLQVDLNGTTVTGTRPLSVPATGLLSLRTDGLGDVQTGSVRVTTDRHVEGVVIFGGATGLAGVGSSSEFPAGFVAPMQRNASLGVNTGIAVTALSAAAAALDLTLLDPSGSVLSQASDTMVANGHKALFVTEIGWDPAVDFSNFSGTLVVSASQPVTATVLQTRPGEFVTLPVAPLQAASASEPAAEYRLYFAQFADGAGALSSQILLFNLSADESATAQLTLRGDAGAPLTVDLNGQPVAGETQVEIGPRGLRVLATDGLGDLQVGSVAVTSNQPLSGVIVFAGPAVGAAGVGSSAELEEGFVAPMETDISRGIDTGVALMSLEAEAMTLDADLLGTNGQLVASAQTPLPGLGHIALYVTAFEWNQPVDFDQFKGLLRIRAAGRTAATVIQTRPGQFATMPVAPKPAD